jgi:hypothetical protein
MATRKEEIPPELRRIASLTPERRKRVREMSQKRLDEVHSELSEIGKYGLIEDLPDKEVERLYRLRNRRNIIQSRISTIRAYDGRPNVIEKKKVTKKKRKK